MTESVSVLDWKSTSEAGDWVASEIADFTVDTDWVFSLAGSTIYAERAIVPRYVVVDNYANNGLVQATFGPFSWTVGQFERKTFLLPIKSQTLRITGTVGAIGVTFAEKLDLLPDAANALSIQTAANQAVSYPFSNAILNTGPQAADHQNKRIVFAPTVADIDYNLLDVATLANGWESRSLYNLGTKNVSIVPAAGNSINGLWQPATPLILAPGDYLNDFAGDGSAWYAHGKQSFTSADIAIAGTVTDTQTHNMQLTDIGDVEAQMFLRNIVAESVFTLGDIIRFGWGASQGAGAATQQNSQVMAAAAAKATQSVFTYMGTGNFTIGLPTTGAAFNLTNARWKWFYKLTRIF